MKATIIDGRTVADGILQDCARRSESMQQQHGRSPGLAVVIVGDNAASQVYVRNKVRDCERAKLRSQKHELPIDTSEEALLNLIAELNGDAAVDGILVQLPLPSHIDERRVLTAIAPQKDVDGFHPENLGRLVSGLPALWPCTPSGCMVLLKHSNTPIAGQTAVIIGRSNIVGKPMALMLINAGATVTVCNSQTPDLAAVTRRADILIAAVGRAKMVGAEMVKKGATVIDVGINRTAEGIVGDVDYAAVGDIAGKITPVPGGVGPMTIAMLIANTLQAAQA